MRGISSLNEDELIIDHQIFDILNTGDREKKRRLKKILRNRIKIIDNMLKRDLI